MHLCYGLHMPRSERDPCPGCGRLTARHTPRFPHRCPHGRDCIGSRHHGISWERGGWEHWKRCPECCEAARAADGTAPGVFDCHRCNVPLPFNPDPFADHCPPPPAGAVLVMGVRCAKCGKAFAYRITGERVTRLAPRASAVRDSVSP